MIRRPLHRSDQNWKLIVQALRDVGAKVYDLGEPLDLLVGFRGKLALLELKNNQRSPSGRRLRASQQRFIEEWQGYPVFTVTTPSEAFEALGIQIAS